MHFLDMNQDIISITGRRMSTFAFGAGAHGYVNGVRYQNNGPIQHYLTPLRDEKLPIFFRDFVNKKNN